MTDAEPDVPEVQLCPPGHWRTRAEAVRGLADALGEAPSINTIQKWVFDPECPIPQGGGPIPIEATIAWVRQKKSTPGPAPSANPEREIRAKLLEHKLNQQLGLLVAVADVERDVTSATAILHRTLFEELPSRIYTACNGVVMEDAIEEVRTLLKEAVNSYAKEATKAAREVSGT